MYVLILGGPSERKVGKTALFNLLIDKPSENKKGATSILRQSREGKLANGRQVSFVYEDTSSTIKEVGKTLQNKKSFNSRDVYIVLYEYNHK